MAQFGSGNTYGKGRPKGSKRPEICKKFAEEEGFAALIRLAKGRFKYKNDKGIEKEGDAGWRNPKGGGRPFWAGPSIELTFEALKLALAYGAGKPADSVDITSGGETLADWAFAHFARKREEQQDRPHIGHGQ